MVGVCGDLLNVGLEGGLGHQGDRPLVHEESATPPSLRVKTVRDLQYSGFCEGYMGYNNNMHVSMILLHHLKFLGESIKYLHNFVT